LPRRVLIDVDYYSSRIVRSILHIQNLIPFFYLFYFYFERPPLFPPVLFLIDFIDFLNLESLLLYRLGFLLRVEGLFGAVETGVVAFEFSLLPHASSDMASVGVIGNTVGKDRSETDGTDEPEPSNNLLRTSPTVELSSMSVPVLEARRWTHGRNLTVEVLLPAYLPPPPFGSSVVEERVEERRLL
jgi:hypothetical protein